MSLEHIKVCPSLSGGLRYHGVDPKILLNICIYYIFNIIYMFWYEARGVQAQELVLKALQDVDVGILSLDSQDLMFVLILIWAQYSLDLRPGNQWSVIIITSACFFLASMCFLYVFLPPVKANAEIMRCFCGIRLCLLSLEGSCPFWSWISRSVTWIQTSI